MKSSTISAVLAFLVVASASAFKNAARQVEYAQFMLVGTDGIGRYADYLLLVPEDGSTVPIKNPLVVVSIEPRSDDYNCTFFGSEGSVTNLGAAIGVDPPQPQISATCAAVA